MVPTGKVITFRDRTKSNCGKCTENAANNNIVTSVAKDHGQQATTLDLVRNHDAAEPKVCYLNVMVASRSCRCTYETNEEVASDLNVKPTMRTNRKECFPV